MKISEIPFEITDWSDVEPTRHAGLSGEALWRTRHVGPEGNRIRVRMVEYTPGYVADHWCQKGHVLLVLQRGRRSPRSSASLATACRRRSAAPAGRCATHQTQLIRDRSPDRFSPSDHRPSSNQRA
jgi:hypothetical protein